MKKVVLSDSQKKLLKQFQSPFLMKLFFLKKLPTLFFWKTKVEEISQTKGSVSIPYGWRTQNPFRSIYFGSQAGAAELSTGIIALLATKGHNVSMLVVEMKATFVKKATSRITFTCDEGDKIFDAVEKTLKTGEGQTTLVKTTGIQKTGEVVSEFEFMWAFKRR